MTAGLTGDDPADMPTVTIGGDWSYYVNFA